MSANPIVGRASRHGINVSTVYLADRGYWETCLFDDRNGKRYGNSSRVVDGYGDEHAARAGHSEWLSRSLDDLLSAIYPTRVDNDAIVN